MSGLYFTEHPFRRITDLIPKINVWIREEAKGRYFSWFGYTIGWRTENQDYILNEAIKEAKKEGKKQ